MQRPEGTVDPDESNVAASLSIALFGHIRAVVRQLR